MALDYQPIQHGLASVGSQVHQLRPLAGVPVVYVTKALARYRHSLLTTNGGFRVPGKLEALPRASI